MAIIKLYHDSSNLFSLSETSSSFLNRFTSVNTGSPHGTNDFPDTTNNLSDLFVDPLSVKHEPLDPISDNNTQPYHCNDNNSSQLSKHSRDTGCTCSKYSKHEPLDPLTPSVIITLDIIRLMKKTIIDSLNTLETLVAHAGCIQFVNWKTNHLYWTISLKNL
uniref:Uncharacterized protein n=1 Tax=Cacopsylla melanoneura TaxID=428564 RepID=A0A8D8ZKP1_9HEMI